MMYGYSYISWDSWDMLSTVKSQDWTGFFLTLITHFLQDGRVPMCRDQAGGRVESWQLCPLAWRLPVAEERPPGRTPAPNAEL